MYVLKYVINKSLSLRPVWLVCQKNKFMKRVLLVVFVGIFASVLSFAQIHKVEVKNPTYLGMILIDQKDVPTMKSTCAYYNLVEQPEEGDVSVYTYSDGTKIRFKKDETEGLSFPVVQIITSRKSADVNKILVESGFEKSGDAYYNGSKFAHRRTKCTVTSGAVSTLTFSKVYSNTDQ